jgi:hypothetical protein
MAASPLFPQAPDLNTSYIVNPGGNQLSVTDGQTIIFPAVQVGTQASSVTFIVHNRGTATGVLNRATIDGEGFQLSGLPLIPSQILPDREVRFTLLFSPLASGRFTGTLVLQLGSTLRVIRLQGDGTAPVLVYEYVSGSDTLPLPTSGPLAFGEVELGATRTILVRVRNTGNAVGRVGVAAVSGTSFQLADAPIFPVNIAAGGVLELPVQFRPVEPGEAAGRLRIDNVTVNLAGTGLGPRFTYAFRVNEVVTPVPRDGTVIFPTTEVGRTGTLEMRVSNTGNRVAVLSAVALSGIFRFPAPVNLPVALEPGETFTFDIAVTPENVGTVSGLLQINEARFNLQASGNPPGAIPAVELRLTSNVAEALQQPGVSLVLDAPYYLDMHGRLTMTFSSETFVDDGAIQFATGGRSVEFRILAGQTQAEFPDGSRQLPFQVGTVAGTVSISATLGVRSFDVTPNPAPSRFLTIAPAPPRIRTVQVVPRSSSVFELVISGISTPRSVSELNFTFTPSPGARLQSTTLTADVDAAFSTWYQNISSRQFGSQFSAIVTILVSGDSTTIQAVTVAARNSQGTGTPVSVNLR